MKEVLTHIHNFMASQSLPTVLRELRSGKLDFLMKSAYTWLVVAAISMYLLWTRKFKAIIALASVFLFVLLAQKTLAQSGAPMDLRNVLTFVAGTAALVGLNLYLLFVRE
ncbi:MAG: hypothetical protein P4L43_00990 [Syntrophobacteraceae bacterium]|nr:hypothetical protein [Syntrophobacteraceae bacterium]